MGISRQAFENVGFIGVHAREGSSAIEWKGTCFFIEEAALEPSAKIWGYLVTARHVAEQVAGKEYFLRLNRIGGGSEILGGAPPSVRWWTHPSDHTTDVAVIRWLPSEKIFSVKRWPVDGFVTPTDFSAGTFNVGDDVDMIGLFNLAPGVEKNSPILRRGTLAMVPDDPVLTGRGLAEAYLVEAHSIGGMSGSPALVTAATIHPHPSGPRLRGIGRSALLGLVHGHWNDPAEKHLGRDARHSGVSIVVPAHKIVEVISQPEMLELKRQELPALLRS